MAEAPRVTSTADLTTPTTVGPTPDPPPAPPNNDPTPPPAGTTLPPGDPSGWPTPTPTPSTGTGQVQTPESSWPVINGVPTPPDQVPPVINPPGSAGGLTGGNPSNALDTMLGAFPWLRQLGIPVSQLQAWVVQGLTGDALYQSVTKTPQYQTMFPAIRRDDGTLRMSEAQYLATQDQYRVLLKQYGDPSYAYSSPADLAPFFSQEIDPNELKQRFDTYVQVKQGSQDIKDAFYVYAGMQPSDDQLYYAMVSPTARAAMVDEYNQKVAAQPLDYGTWITRATEAGLSRVQDALGNLQNAGVLTGTAISQVQNLDPNFARQMMDVLYHGGDPSGQTTQLLNLNQLMNSFQYAMLGSAATQSGFALPDQDRIEAIRAAGITRDKALSAYSDLSQQQNALSGMVQRAGLGTEFSQDDFEKAVLLQQGPAAGQLANAQAQDKAAGHVSGSSQLSQDQSTGRMIQPGLRGSFS